MIVAPMPGGADGDGPRSRAARAGAASTARRAITCAIAGGTLAGPDVADRGRGLGGRARGAAIGSAPASEPISACSAAGTRRIVGASAVSATRASATTPSVERDHGGRADDGDLHRPAVLEPEVAAAGSRGTARGRGWRRTARRARRWCDPARSKSSATATQRVPAVERSVAVGAQHTSGEPVSIAGEAFITLPPSVPTLRVAWEPTIADASASAASRARIAGWATMAWWPARRAGTPRRLGDPRGSSSMRSMATSRSGSGALPWRAPTTRSLPPATGRAPAASAATPRRGCGRRERLDAHAPSSGWAVSHTRSAVIGSRVTGAPITLAMAFEMAAAVGDVRRLGDALGAAWPGVRRVDLHEVDVDRRCVGGGLQLVLEQVRRCAAGLPRRARCLR